MLKRIPNVFWIVLTWWTGYSLIFSVHVASVSGPGGLQMSAWQALGFSFASWMMWVPISLGLYWLARRYPIERGQIARAVPLLMGIPVVVVLLRSVYFEHTNHVFRWYGPDPLPPFREIVLSNLTANFLLTWIVIGLAHALIFHERAVDREKTIDELQASLAEARIEALRAKMNPHFLLNALNSAAEMVHHDAELADRMLVSLSALLQDGLSFSHDPLRPLRHEVALVEHYLEIEQVRLGERLNINWQVDVRCLDLPVPPLILQPLVENAIRHAIARSPHPGRLSIDLRLKADGVSITVSNTLAPQSQPSHGTGVGLKATRNRLDLLYGDRARLGYGVENGSYVVRIFLPAQAKGRAVAPKQEVRP
ncbi:sensor histidine kinase [Lysobacter gummosus]|uniref:Histidine kinase n=1 Tax=Lysobacter gummosus TaxID=262324 RepID=A0ABY3X9A9_9GAMM|nr:histidine kinase [Lysobacter gummosus]ALN93749.1 histidine kinase-, DNA gyrase B-, and HSP90-like ATPase family protein [Lysobacter gummosus]UNP29176.1 histidine kinase [Lysobacter gummosus]